MSVTNQMPKTTGFYVKSKGPPAPKALAIWLVSILTIQFDGALTEPLLSAGGESCNGSTRRLVVEQRESQRHQFLSTALHRHPDRCMGICGDTWRHWHDAVKQHITSEAALAGVPLDCEVFGMFSDLLLAALLEEGSDLEWGRQ